MSAQFARIFGLPEKQILVILDQDDEGKPEIQFKFKPDGLGLCTMNIGNFKNNGAGYEAARKIFDALEEPRVVKTIEDIAESLGVGDTNAK